MYGVDMSKKENRLASRQIYHDKDAMQIDLPEIQFQAFVSEKEAADGTMRYYLTTFTGTAGKPDSNYYYRTRERRDEALQKAIDSQKRHIEYKAQRKVENKGNLTGSAATAKAIKARLIKEFPGVKFSVTSDNFSMGNSVDIRWTDGPMDEAVSAITDQYEYGRFDGMQDLSYNVPIDTVGLGCPGAKYVHTNRTLSPEYKAQIEAILERDFVPRHSFGYAPYQWNEAEKRLIIAANPQQVEKLPEVVEVVETQQEVISSVEPEAPEPKQTNVISIDGQATRQQLWALHCITRLNTTTWKISKREASELIAKSKNGENILPLVQGF